MTKTVIGLSLKIAIILSLLLSVAISALGQEKAPDFGKAGRSVAEFVDSAGRFDLEAARRSGYQGSLDMKGFKSTIDPATGQPVFQLSKATATADDPDDIYWDNSISPCIRGVNDGYIYATTIYDGKLIFGGQFTIVGCVIANNIASWDGTAWSALGLGVDSVVIALTVYNGNLIAGGSFSTAGGISACIAGDIIYRLIRAHG